jgi:hypothetical protein
MRLGRALDGVVESVECQIQHGVRTVGGVVVESVRAGPRGEQKKKAVPAAVHRTTWYSVIVLGEEVGNLQNHVMSVRIHRSAYREVQVQRVFNARCC